MDIVLIFHKRYKNPNNYGNIVDLANLIGRECSHVFRSFLRAAGNRILFRINR